VRFVLVLVASARAFGPLVVDSYALGIVKRNGTHELRVVRVELTSLVESMSTELVLTC